MKKTSGVILDARRLKMAWDRIEPELSKQDNGCWLLLRGNAALDYYPCITVEDFHEAAHRISYRHHKGELPDGHIVRHTCDVRRCCNPAHLISGTIYDNMRDKFERGRCHRMIGEDANRAKISNADVMVIYHSDEPRDDLAERYGVWPHMITRIRASQHSLTAHLPPRKFNDKAHFTEARKQAIRDGHKRRTEPRRKPAQPVIYPDRKGAKHANSKLSETDARAIYASPLSHDEAAVLYGVSNRLIRDVRAGRHWATKSLAV